MTDFLGLMKQATQLQAKMQEMQAELDQITVDGMAGGGLVSVTLSAKGDLKGVRIDDSLVKPGEKEIIERIIKDDGGKGNIKFVRDGEFKSDYTIIIGGKNFGCGSSREHAPLALAEAGVKCVIAEFYARIFFRNSINGGYLLPLESKHRLVEKIRTGDELVVDLDKLTVTNKTKNETYELNPVGDVLPIIEAGGVFNYAKQAGMMK